MLYQRPDERLGRDTVATMRWLGQGSGITVVSALYAALYELSRRTNQTPRTVLDVLFREAPSDDEWLLSMLPALEQMLDDEGERAA
jgi:hypothetical protein